MESPPPATCAPPTTAATSPRPPMAPSKLRLMCSYGGHIIPRPHDKSLFYSGGETRIIALDRRTTAASLSALTAHFSRVLFHNRPFLLKYQLPNEDLDSLISVITDEDLSIMLEEHDRIAPPARIRLFLFPMKPESLGSTLLDRKSDIWFSDALKNTGILQKGQSADSGLLLGLGPDFEAPVDTRSNSGGGGKLGAESVILETSSSFGSTNSSFSMSNSPAVGVTHCDEKSLNLLDRKVRVPSSASLESDNSVGSTPVPKTENLLEPLIQVGPEESSESTVSDPPLNIMTQKSVQAIGYPLSPPLDGMKQQYETQLSQGLHYVPQYTGSVPMSPYYPVYQLPLPQPQQIPTPQSHPPYPIYLVPVQPNQYRNLSMQCAPFDASATSSSCQQPFNSQNAAIAQSIAHKEALGSQIPESAAQVYCNIPAAAQLVGVPSNIQGELYVGPPEPQIISEPVITASVKSGSQSSEFDEDVAYNQIYKTQPLPPILPSQYQAMTKGAAVVSEPSIQLQSNLA